MTSIIEILARVRDEASSKLDDINQKIKDFKASTVYKEADASAKGFRETILGVSASLEKQQKQLRGLQREILAFSLSIMFVGFALRRFTDNVFRGLFNTMKMVSHETSEFNVLTNQLSANWEFLKWSIMDALMQTGVYEKFVNFLIGMMQRFNDLDDSTKVWLVRLTAIAAVVGTLMIIWGQFGTLIAGALLKIVAGFTAVWKWLKIIRWTFIASFWAAAKAVFVALAPILLLIAAFTAIVVGIWWVSRNWDLVWNGMKVVFFATIRTIADMWDWSINKMIDGLNWLIRQMNRVPGLSIGEIGRNSFFRNIGTAANNRIADLHRERQDLQAQTGPTQTTNNYNVNIREIGPGWSLMDLNNQLERDRIIALGSAT